MNDGSIRRCSPVSRRWWPLSSAMHVSSRRCRSAVPQITRRRLVLAHPATGYRHSLPLRRLVSVGAKSSVATAAEMEGHLAPGRLVLAIRAVDLTLQIEDAAHRSTGARRPRARPKFIAVNVELVASTNSGPCASAPQQAKIKWMIQVAASSPSSVNCPRSPSNAQSLFMIAAREQAHWHRVEPITLPTCCSNVWRIQKNPVCWE